MEAGGVATNGTTSVVIATLLFALGIHGLVVGSEIEIESSYAATCGPSSTHPG